MEPKRETPASETSAEERLPDPVGGEFEERKYQLNMFDEVKDDNSLVVLPTALGKTMIAVFVAAEKVEKSDGPILFLAPSKPLCEQHAETLGEHLDAEVQVVTGETQLATKRPSMSAGTYQMRRSSGSRRNTRMPKYASRARAMKVRERKNQ